MRKVFTEALVELAGRDPRILLLTGDLGYSVLEPFCEAFPDRFFNVGVAEQNMVMLATGLAEAGFIPYVYSIATFAALRPYEAIRVGPILHRLPVRIVGIGSGFEYGHNGISHYNLEDVAVMRTQPGLRVIVPADAPQARAAIEATWDAPGPIYFRLSKDDNLILPGLEARFEPGRAQRIGAGRDLAIVTLGSAAVHASKAVSQLAEQGIQASLLVVSDLNPPPAADLVEALGSFSFALTVEAHYVTGGLASLVSEVIAQNGLVCRLFPCAVREMPDGHIGVQSYMEHQTGISTAAIVETALHAVSR